MRTIIGILMMVFGSSTPPAEQLVVQVDIPAGCYLWVERFYIPQDPDHPNTPWVLVCPEAM